LAIDELDDFVVLRTFLTSIDAELAASALEAAGISAVIRADDCGGVRPHLWMGGIRLLVRAHDATDAAAVLDSPAIQEAG
jgi:hypothetical protein